MTNHTPTHDEIAAHAYQIYLRDGGGEGRDMEHWLQAEAELRSGAMNGNSHGHGQATATTASATERSTTPPPSRTKENILPNSVVSPTAPIAQVSPQARGNTPRKGSGKREAAAAAR